MTASTSIEWNEIISKKLKPNQTLEDLFFHYPDHIVLPPNVTANDIQETTTLRTAPVGWNTMAHIASNDPAEINRLAHLSLNQGANALSFHAEDEESLQQSLIGIQTEYLYTRIISNRSLNIEGYENINVICPASIKSIRIPKEDRLNFIKSHLAKTTEQEVELVVSVGKNMLYEISFLRALRQIYERNNVSFHLIGKLSIEGNNELGDYNLIEKTYKCISMILGTVDSILLDYNGEEQDRLTLNIHNILDLESGMKKVIDPLRGAYYVEKLTQAIVASIAP